MLVANADGAVRHKYTFNDGLASDPILDEGVVGGNNATLVDPAGIAAIAGGMADLSFNNGANSNQDFTAPGARGAYINLPNFTATDAAFFGVTGEVSFEAWFTVDENRDWARLFDFGTSNAGEDVSSGAGGSAYIIAVPRSGTNPVLTEPTFATSTHSATGQESFLQPATPAPLATGVEHHVVVTIDVSDTTAGANGTMNLYHNGALVSTGPVENTGTPPIDVTDLAEVNSWLGRAQWPDPLFDGLYNEFRIYDNELSPTDVSNSFAAGPDPVNLPLVIVNRDTGQVSFSNPNGSPVQLTDYRITSAAGGLDPSGFTSIDADNTFDPDGTWTAPSTTSEEIAESGTGNGGTIAAGANPGPGIGAAWMPSIFEDLRVEVELNDGTHTGALVQYIGNGGDPFQRSDLTADGDLNIDDWFAFADGSHVDLSGMTPAQAYLHGDLDGDGDNDFFDFRLFKADYIGDNGAAAFAALPDIGAVVPEPSTAILAMLGLLALGAARRKRTF
jgi:hypothetical protein